MIIAVTRPSSKGTKNQVATIINKHRRNLNEMVHESCNMLSELTHLTSVALGNASDDTLQRISVVPSSKSTFPKL